ncbi:polyprenyl glycosylphosphotransferase [Marmoricola endophyticus]|uniref:Polyprenyl glycosylphosphotransferase n=1 Tax=Marmoricola endophyticus TaxID=2040280 RepID=A0A917F6P1_9ACTN|nr:sugar transferase [Marmoricola endophyticus]GGF51636.1 polyprenyl glycosylphosphotransferase [Marmoricola endophyticus]
MTTLTTQRTVDRAVEDRSRSLLRTGARRRRPTLPLLAVTLDAVVIVGVIVAASALRVALPFDRDAGAVNQLVSQIGGPMAVAWLVLLALFGTYDVHRLNTGVEMYRSVMTASVVAAGVVGIVCYLGKIPLSRGFFVLSFLLGIPLLVLARLLLRRAFHRARVRGRFPLRVLLAGDAAHVDEIATVLRRETWLGYAIVGALSPGPAPGAPSTKSGPETPGGVAYVGTADHAASLAEEGAVDAIIVARGAYPTSEALRRAQWALEEHRVQVIVAPSITDMAAERVAVRPVAGLPLVHLERPTGRNALRWAKRSFDLIAGAALLVAFSPVMLAGAIAVRRHDGGPVLFRQRRVGRDGATFTMLKFRSMVVDAEQQQAGLAPEERHDGPMFKMAQDPRVTPPGRWMRRFSVDELPQLVNVLRGEMSLVGPRPALPTERGHWDEDVARRMRVRPGMTGLWQVSGRSDLSWQDTVRLDLYYVDNWSMVQDAVILLRTLRAVLASAGAY